MSEHYRRLTTRVTPPRSRTDAREQQHCPVRRRLAAEVKWDGFRIVATVAEGKVRLRSRPGSDASDWFPELVALPPGLEEHDAVLDGEVVIESPCWQVPRYFPADDLTHVHEATKKLASKASSSSGPMPPTNAAGGAHRGSR